MMLKNSVRDEYVLHVQRKRRKMRNAFLPADIMLPKETSLEAWAVIACDQFTSQPEYWQKVYAKVGDKRSSLKMILPEAELNDMDHEGRIISIHAEMEKERELMTIYPASYVYVERTLLNGNIRRGIVGKIDLDEYDYSDETLSGIRATEKTVIERIPPRMEVRRNAVLDLPHVILLCDDAMDMILGSIEKKKEQLELLYDFQTMLEGGRLRGWLVSGEDAVELKQVIQQYESDRRRMDEKPLLYCVGDGNHSLATAKSCYEELKATYPECDFSTHPMRYALVELENIRDDAQVFEPIHRVVINTDADALISLVKTEMADEDSEETFCYFNGKNSGELPGGKHCVGMLQTILDRYLEKNVGEIDYIHGEDALRKIAEKNDCVGFILPAMDKRELFDIVQKGGVLPRKTFSMGHAQEKRYYLEARKLKEENEYASDYSGCRHGPKA